MEMLAYLIPVALALGGLGLAAFLWALRAGQFEDLDGAAHRILFEEEPGREARERGPQASGRHARSRGQSAERSR